MNEIKIWSAALALLLVGAYLSYTKKDEAGTTEAVTIVDQKKDALQEIVLYAKTQTVSVSLRDADGQKYGWFEVEVRKRKRAFAGNEETDKLIEGFAPFKALRSLGKDLAGKEFEETKLQKPERRLVLNYGGSPKEFEIGGRTSGARDHYLKAKGGNEIYLVASKILGDLEYPEGKYMQRKLRTAKLDQVEKVSLVAGGKTKVALQRNKAGGKDAFWANEATPDEKNETLGNYLDKLDKLTATDYLDDAKAIAGAATLLEATWFGEEDKNLGTVKLLKKGEGKDAEYYASSTATHLPVKISRFTTEQLEKDLGTIMAPVTREQELAELLTLEARAQAERAQADLAQLTAHQAEQAGQSLIDLVVIDEGPGLGGLTVLTLRKRNRSLALPRVRIQAGDPVRIQTPTGPQGLRGVVVQKNAEHLKVAIGDEAAELDLEATFRVDRSADEITTDRLLRTLRRLEGAQKNRLAELKQIGAGERALGVGVEADPGPTPNLDPTQAAAVQFALHSPDWALIHGPPGTGKTTAVVELIVQAAARGERILVTAPSNLAVDNLLERLLARGLLPVRLGHPARVLPQVEGRVLSVLVEESEEVRISRNLVKEALQLRRKAQKWTRAKPAPGEKAAMEREARERFADARRLEAMAVERILDQAQIVGATCTFDDSQLKGRRFDRVVVDEACQATEPATWAPILHGDRVVLAGDHLQLPPTVISPEAAARGLSVSLFERLHARYGDAISRRLGVQYRMHQAIMGYSSLALYDGGIVAAPAVQDHLLIDILGIERTPLTETPLLFVDTAGAGHQERVGADGESRANPEEATVVANLGRQLLELGLSPLQLGVITPYSAQANLLRELLPEAVEVDTVDGFQGREKEAILISCVRSNDQGQIGFLADVRRMNVALTRARRKLVVVGDSATLSGHPFYRDLLEWFEAAGAYTTVWELPT